MLTKKLLSLVFTFVIGGVIAGCAGTSSKQEQYSGYFENYSQMEKTKDIKGAFVLRYVSPRLTKENYQKVIVEPVQYFPEPKPTQKVSAKVLRELKEYINRTFKQMVKQQIQVVDHPGPGVARMRIALTAVGTKQQNLNPYQYIPVALLITASQAAVQGGRPEEATLFLEAEMTDSISGERLGIAVRQGTGERLERLRQSEQVVTTEALTPLIDNWSQAYTEYIFSRFEKE